MRWVHLLSQKMDQLKVQSAILTEYTFDPPRSVCVFIITLVFGLSHKQLQPINTDGRGIIELAVEQKYQQLFTKLKPNRRLHL